jgi:hypothetical protein
MKTTILALVAFLLLGTTSAFAQFSSSPIEPGLRDHLNNHKSSATVRILNDRKMLVNDIATEWISQDQVTLSAVVIELNRLTDASRDRVARQLLEYNVSSSIGTLSLDSGTVRMVHHLNPRYVTPVEMTKVVAKFKAAVEEQRKSLDKSLAVK